MLSAIRTAAFLCIDNDQPQPAPVAATIGKLTADKRRNAAPEQALQTAIVSYWRPKLVPGARLFATNGELPGGVEQIRRAARRKAMGYTLGTPDLCARRPGYLLWLEVKVPGNYPTAEQANWATWAADCADGWCVVNSIEDAGAVLKAWGMVA
jgi:hypothetical protein